MDSARFVYKMPTDVISCRKGGCFPLKSNETVKIFVLYLMQNVGYPLDYITVNDMIRQTDYVIYLDFAEAFHDLLDTDMIREQGKNEHNEPLYIVTDKGRLVCEELGKSRTPIVLENALAAALRFLDFQKRDVKIYSRIEDTEDDRFWFVCGMTEKGVVIMEDRILVDTRGRAIQMEQNFRKRPEAIYRGTVALLSGNVNFLL